MYRSVAHSTAFKLGQKMEERYQAMAQTTTRLTVLKESLDKEKSTARKQTQAILSTLEEAVIATDLRSDEAFLLCVTEAQRIEDIGQDPDTLETRSRVTAAMSQMTRSVKHLEEAWSHYENARSRIEDEAAERVDRFGQAQDRLKSAQELVAEAKSQSMRSFALCMATQRRIESIETEPETMDREDRLFDATAQLLLDIEKENESWEHFEEKLGTMIKGAQEFLVSAGHS